MCRFAAFCLGSGPEAVLSRLACQRKPIGRLGSNRGLPFSPRVKLPGDSRKPVCYTDINGASGGGGNPCGVRDEWRLLENRCHNPLGLNAASGACKPTDAVGSKTRNPGPYMNCGFSKAFTRHRWRRNPPSGATLKRCLSATGWQRFVLRERRKTVAAAHEQMCSTRAKIFQEGWFFCCAFVAISWGIVSWLFSAAEKVSG